MPSDPRALRRTNQPVGHQPIVTWGHGTYGVECMALDFVSQERFATEAEARRSPDMLAHLFVMTGHHVAVDMAPAQPHFFLACLCGWTGEQRFRRRFDALMDPAGEAHLTLTATSATRGRS